MVSFGSYLLGAVELAAVVLSVAFSAYRLRSRLLPAWAGAPGRLVETIAAVALLIWISELLGALSLLYPGLLVVAAVLVAGVSALWPAGPAPPVSPTVLGAGRPSAPRGAPTGGSPPVESGWQVIVMVAVIAVVAFHWAVTTKHALDRGIFNFDSLWYHMPFAADMAQSHSAVGMDHVETVFTNWFYPQNSELLHAVGILLTGRDTLSLFLNFGWLAVGFLAAWCIGRPYGRGSLAVVAAAILLECHTLVVRDPGAAKNDLAAAALLLAAVAVLVTAWNARNGKTALRLEPGWGLAAAGLAVGLAAGTRVTVLAMAAALSLAALVLAPVARRWAAAAWWFLPALAGGAFWYLRNLVVAGNPLPEIEHLGPISLPHPERLQEGRPDFSIVHYATDTRVWRHYFSPGLHEAFGALWPLVVGGAALAALLALVSGRDRIVRWLGGVALFGLIAYLFTPLSAAGAEGEPVGFGINIRYVIPALLAGIVLLPLPRFFDDRRRQWGLMAVLVVVFLVTDRPDDALHDSARVFALLFVVLAVIVPAGLWLLRERRGAQLAFVGGLAALALVVVAVGYPVQRHYLEGRFANTGSHEEQIPGMDLDSTYRWSRGIENARIGLAGTAAGFAGYGLYGTDLSNEVRYLGAEGPHGAFNAIPTCSQFRAAVNAADLDYLVTSPFLNFLHPGDPITSPEARWLRGEDAVSPVLHSGPVTVWKVTGELDPSACGPANAPLREVPNTPGA
jgi:predicted membrane channel-forming protein YqfA (hemolysin III family)